MAGEPGGLSDVSERRSFETSVYGVYGRKGIKGDEGDRGKFIKNLSILSSL